MRMRKLIILFLSLLTLLPLTAMADEGVVVQLKSGKTMAFAFTDKPTIVPAEVLTIRTKSGNQLELSYGDVDRFYWSDNISTAIVTPKATATGNPVFHIADNSITAEGLAAGEHVSVFTADGRQMGSATAMGGKASVALPQQGGIYIIKTSSGVSYKFIKK